MTSSDAVETQIDPGAPGSEQKSKAYVKFSTNLPPVVFDALRELAEMRGTSMTEILRRAISNEKFFQEAIARGDKILLQGKDDRSIRELVFR